MGELTDLERRALCRTGPTSRSGTRTGRSTARLDPTGSGGRTLATALCRRSRGAEGRTGRRCAVPCRKGLWPPSRQRRRRSRAGRGGASRPRRRTGSLARRGWRTGIRWCSRTRHGARRRQRRRLVHRPRRGLWWWESLTTLRGGSRRRPRRRGRLRRGLALAGPEARIGRHRTVRVNARRRAGWGYMSGRGRGTWRRKWSTARWLTGLGPRLRRLGRSIGSGQLRARLRSRGMRRSVPMSAHMSAPMSARREARRHARRHAGRHPLRLERRRSATLRLDTARLLLGWRRGRCSGRRRLRLSRKRRGRRMTVRIGLGERLVATGVA